MYQERKTKPNAINIEQHWYHLERKMIEKKSLFQSHVKLVTNCASSQRRMGFNDLSYCRGEQQVANKSKSIGTCSLCSSFSRI